MLFSTLSVIIILLFNRPHRPLSTERARSFEYAPKAEGVPRAYSVEYRTRFFPSSLTANQVHYRALGSYTDLYYLSGRSKVGTKVGGDSPRSGDEQGHIDGCMRVHLEVKSVI